MKSKILIGMLLFGSLIHVSDKALLEAVKSGNVTEVNKVLASGVNLKNYGLGWDALYYAIRNDRNTNEIIQALLKNGANINERADRKKFTLLMQAIVDQNYNAAKILVDLGADTRNLRDNNNKTALDYAKEVDKERHHNSYQSLLKYFPNIQYRNMNLNASSLTPPEYIAEKTKNMDENTLNAMSDQQHDALLQAAQENEVDYIYRKFFPAYEQFVIRNGSLPLIKFFNDFIFPKPNLLGIMASKIFISAQALYDCLDELAKKSTNIDTINILNNLLEQTKIIMSMRNEPSIPDKPVRFATDKPE